MLIKFFGNRFPSANIVSAWLSPWGRRRRGSSSSSRSSGWPRRWGPRRGGRSWAAPPSHCTHSPPPPSPWSGAERTSCDELFRKLWQQWWIILLETTFSHAKLTKSFSTSWRGHREGWCQCQGRSPLRQSLEASHARRAWPWRRSWTWSASPPGPGDTREPLTGNWIELEVEFNWIEIFLLTKCKCELYRGKWKLMSTFTWRYSLLPLP